MAQEPAWISAGNRTMLFQRKHAFILYCPWRQRSFNSSL